MTFDVRQTEAFAEWIGSLRDRREADRITARISRAADGNFGDVKYFEGIGDMRIHYGPGYRLYFVRRGEALVVLLCGGDKDSQERDIRRAKDMARDV